MARRTVGSIRPDGPNRWVVQVSAGRDAEGKRRRITRRLRGSKAEAERLLASLLGGADLASSKTTVEQYLVERWMPSKVNLQVTTRVEYLDIIRSKVVPHLGFVELSKLSPLDIDGWLGDLRRTGISEQTVLHAYRLLSGALTQAVKWELLHRNPAKSVDPPKPATPDILRPTLEEALQVIAIFRDHLIQPAVALALGAGLRRSEALGVRWIDLDLEERRVTVAQKRVRPTGHSDVIDEPKTKKSRRTFTIQQWAADSLRSTRRIQMARRLQLGPLWNDSDLVVVDGRGEPLRPGRVSTAFSKLVLENGMRPLKFHGLRHGFATLSVFAGVDLPTLSKRLGHSTTRTTERYFEVIEDADRQAAAKLDRLFQGRGSN